MEHNGMIYHLLEDSIYCNSRYELIQLLEDIYSTQGCTFKNTNAFDDIAKAYELLIDNYFSILPLSEERLAIFLRVYSENGFIPAALIRAFESGSRATIVSVLRQVDIGDNQHCFDLRRRRFYEATIFGDE